MIWDTDKSLAVLSREPMRVLRFLQRNDRLRNAESAEDALARDVYIDKALLSPSVYP